MARMVILDAGLVYSNWPFDRLADSWLHHPRAEIRHVMAYILGYQRRELLKESFRYLLSDISLVPPYYDNPKTLEIMGQTVSEAVVLALQRQA